MHLKNVFLITYKALHGQTPVCLTDLLRPYYSDLPHQSPARGLLTVPHCDRLILNLLIFNFG